MPKKILSISRHQEKLTGIFLEKKGGGYFANFPIELSTSEALLTACKKADEIYVNDSFLSAIYTWRLFPKVKRKDIEHLVVQDALAQLHTREDVHVGFEDVADVAEGGLVKRRIAYIAIKEEDVLEIWDTFKDVGRKIKSVTPLPLCLAKMVSKCDTHPSNFLISHIGSTESMIILSSPDGLVKVARTFPFGTQELERQSIESLALFVSRIAREIVLTVRFFKEKFREPEPSVIYLFGDSGLESIFSQAPLNLPELPEMECRFRMASTPVQNFDAPQLSEHIHVISGVYATERFNFLPYSEVAARRDKRLFYPACAAISLCLLGLLGWHFHLKSQIATENAALMRQYQIASTLKPEVERLNKEKSELLPFRGWKRFIDTTFNNQIAWNELFSELGTLTPSNILIDSFVISRGAQSRWLGQIEGEVVTQTWETGLSDLRAYGAHIESSRFFKVSDVSYAPQNLDRESKNVDFTIKLELEVPK
jgi:hypothetical protein